jgi:hypothetical protein
VRDAEEVILAKKTINCLAPSGVIDLDNPQLIKNEKNILDYCSIKNTDRFYMNISVKDLNSNQIKVLEHGDSGLLWVKSLFKNKKAVEGIIKYQPGIFPNEYTKSYGGDGKYKVFIINNKTKNQGEIFIEILIKSEY